MSENNAFEEGVQDSDDGPTFSAYTFSKSDQKLNNNAAANNRQTGRNLNAAANDRQTGRKLNAGNDRQTDRPDEFPPPDDNDLLQLENKLNSTNPISEADYEEYFDYLYKDGEN